MESKKVKGLLDIEVSVIFDCPYCSASYSMKVTCSDDREVLMGDPLGTEDWYKTVTCDVCAERLPMENVKTRNVSAQLATSSSISSIFFRTCGLKMSPSFASIKIPTHEPPLPKVSEKSMMI